MTRKHEDAWGNMTTYRAATYSYGVTSAGRGRYDPRREKRFFARHHTALYKAHTEGEAAAYYGSHMPPRLRQNPYPPGRRRDAWQRAYDGTDPMGEHHGQNC